MAGTDLLDIPELRHFKHESDNSILPSQVPSVARQVTEIAIAHDDDLITCPRPPLIVNLAVDAAPGCGGVTWPAGRVSLMLQYLLSYFYQRFLRPGHTPSHLLKRKTLEGRTVVELGSGTGLVGIVAGLLHAERVWITDQEPLLDLMQTNVSLNGLNSSVHVAVLDWGAHLPPSIPHEPDLVLAADCVYYEPAFPLLVKTLSALATSSKTEILFCYKKRRKADKRFFGMLKKEFTWTVVADSPSCKDHVREGIFLYRLVKK